MSLSDDAKQALVPRGPVCTVAALLARLPDGDAAEVVAALNDPHVPTAGLQRAMEARGWNPPRQQTIQRHRRGECRCG